MARHITGSNATEIHIGRAASPLPMANLVRLRKGIWAANVYVTVKLRAGGTVLGGEGPAAAGVGVTWVEDGNEFSGFRSWRSGGCESRGGNKNELGDHGRPVTSKGDAPRNRIEPTLKGCGRRGEERKWQMGAMKQATSIVLMSNCSSHTPKGKFLSWTSQYP